MKPESPVVRRPAGPRTWLRRLGLAVVAIVSGLLILLVIVTDLGRGADLDLEAGLFADPDLVLHIHRPDRILNELLDRDAEALVADPNWRWLLGLPDGEGDAPPAFLLDEIEGAEILLATRWAKDSNRAADRLLLVIRPGSSRLPRLLQLCRSRWLYARLVAPNLPAGAVPIWLDGLLYLPGGAGRGDLVIGSALDLVVVGSTLDDVRAYLAARQPEKLGERPGTPNRLSLSRRARGQLQEALARSLGTELARAGHELLGLGEDPSLVTLPADRGASLELELPATPGGSEAGEALAATIARDLPGLPAGAVVADTRGFRLELDAAAATAALARLRDRRLAEEEAPGAARREELRRELSPAAGPQLGDEALDLQLRATRPLRLDRVEREIACWRDLLGRGIALEIGLEGDRRRLLLRLGERAPAGP
ncbi:MAG: hypothetical protein H6807_12190 [Planctomycetes bacterium]|nr:hypothetical protein [Planctomycetota bacterium]